MLHLSHHPPPLADILGKQQLAPELNAGVPVPCRTALQLPTENKEQQELHFEVLLFTKPGISLVSVGPRIVNYIREC